MNNAVLNDFGKLGLFCEDTEITMLVIFFTQASLFLTHFSLQQFQMFLFSCASLLTFSAAEVSEPS